MFLLIYLFRMNIVHKFEKSHNNVDDLSRIFINYIDVYVYSMITIIANDKFLIELKNALIIDFHFHQIYKKFQIQIAENSENTTYHSYRINFDFGLLYFVNRSNSNRIYIFASLKKKVFEFVHDNYVHEDFYKTIDWLRSSTYFLKMKKKVRNYIENCSACQLSKLSRKFSYEELHLIEIIAKSFAQLFMNFIMIFSIIT